MGTAFFECGCSITTEMGTGKILSVDHCPDHRHLFSDEKTLREMATELGEVQNQVDDKTS